MKGKTRTIRVDGETFTVGKIEDLPPKAPRKRGEPKKTYPTDRAYAAIEPGETLLVTDTGKTLQDDQGWWQKRFDAFARKSGLRSYSRRDHEADGVWFTKEPPRPKPVKRPKRDK